MSVGIDRMPNELASSNWVSVSTFANTVSGCCSEAASYTGAKALQGPHHDAQKSTNTVSFARSTSSKFSFVSSIVAISFSLSRCSHCPTAIPRGVFPITSSQVSEGEASVVDRSRPLDLCQPCSRRWLPPVGRSFPSRKVLLHPQRAARGSTPSVFAWRVHLIPQGV